LRLLTLLILGFCLGCDTGTHVIAYTAPWCRQCVIDKPLLQSLPVPVTEVEPAPGMTIPQYEVHRDGNVTTTHDIYRVVELCQETKKN
jgi:hypothetical protein